MKSNYLLIGSTNYCFRKTLHGCLPNQPYKYTFESPQKRIIPYDELDKHLKRKCIKPYYIPKYTKKILLGYDNNGQKIYGYESIIDGEECCIQCGDFFENKIFDICNCISCKEINKHKGYGDIKDNNIIEIEFIYDIQS